MTRKEALDILGNCARWELLHMRRALSLPISTFLNTPEDNRRLEAAKVLLAPEKRGAR